MHNDNINELYSFDFEIHKNILLFPYFNNNCGRGDLP